MKKKFKHSWALVIFIIVLTLAILRFLTVGLTGPTAMMRLNRAYVWENTEVNCYYDASLVASHIRFVAHASNSEQSYASFYNGNKESLLLLLPQKFIVQNNEIKSVQNEQEFQKDLEKHCNKDIHGGVRELEKTNNNEKYLLSKYGIRWVKDFEVEEHYYSCKNKQEEALDSFNQELVENEGKVFIFDRPSDLFCKKEMEYWSL